MYTGLGIPADAKGVLPSAARTRDGLEAENLEDLGGAAPRNKSPRSRDGGKAAGRSGGGRTSSGEGRSSSRGSRGGAAGNEDTKAASPQRAARSSRPRQRTRRAKPADQ